MRIAVTLAALTLAASTARAQGFNAVWASGPTDIWAAGAQGLVMRSTAGSWSRLFSGATTDLRDIWGASATDIWFVGDGGTILRFDGRGINRMQPPAQTDFIAVEGCHANDVWVLGQSEDESQPPPLFQWNGTAWTPQRLPLAFRPAGITLVCAATAARGTPGSPVIAGTTYFDPTPQQRRYAGVVARMQGGQWVAQGYNGRAITDVQLGGTPWTFSYTNGAVTLLGGGDSGSVLLLSNRSGGWTQLPAPPAEYERAIVTGDGSPVLIFNDGFARLVGGQWRRTGGSRPQNQGNQAEAERIQRRMQAISAEIQAGRVTQQLIQEMQQLQQAYMQAATGQTGTTEQILQQQMAAAQTMHTLGFGRGAAAFAPRTGTDFYVANDQGSVFRVSGTTSAMLYSPLCASSPQLCGR